MYSLGKRRLRGDLIATSQHLKVGYKEDGHSLFTKSHMEKRGGNRYKLLLVRLDKKGKIFSHIEQSVMGINSPDMRGTAQHLTFLRFRGTGC